MADTPDAKRVPMVVTFLKMSQMPPGPPPPMPAGKLAIMRAETPPAHFYRYLYDTVGGPYTWVDRKKIDDAALGAIIHDSDVELFVLYVQGNPAGMAEIDFRPEAQDKDQTKDAGRIAYFGLMPEYIGRRLGYYFLYHTVANAFARPIATLLVNTCTLDHPRALPLYQRIGFAPYARENRYIELP